MAMNSLRILIRIPVRKAANLCPLLFIGSKYWSVPKMAFHIYCLIFLLIIQGLLAFIWTEGYSGRSSNPGLALAILVL